MLLRLEYEGKTLHEVSSAALREPIVIGRSTQCQWQVPPNEDFLSKRHAELSVRHKQVVIRDLESRNGIFFEGERVQEHRLRIGDKITMGNLTLLAEPEVVQKHVTLHHCITVRAGKLRGTACDIPAGGEPVTVGSEPGAKLLILEPLISKRHAEIKVHPDGSCWVEDKNSKNGTSVNGETLPGGKERLLHSGDRIAFAHVEVVYTDGTENRVLRTVLRQAGIAVACLAILVGGYVIWKQTLKTTATDYLKTARACCQKEDFDGAVKALNATSDSADLRKHEAEIQQMMTSIARWRGICKGWTQTRAAVDSGDLVTAMRALSDILSDDAIKAWTWNNDATRALAQAKSLKKLLDRQALARNLLADPRATATSFQEAADALRAMTNEVAAVQAVDAAKLLDIVKGDRKALEQARREMTVVDEAVAGLNTSNTDVSAVAAARAVVEAARKSSIRAVNERAGFVQPAVVALEQGYKQYAVLLAACCAFDWARADVTQVTPDEAGEFIRDPRLSAARRGLGQREKVLRDCIGDIRPRMRKLVTGPAWSADLEARLALLEDADVMAKVLACDSLERPFPKRSRSKPCGEFDRVIGLEYFQDGLERMTTELQVVTVESGTTWQPVVPALAEALHEMVLLTQTLEDPRYRGLPTGTLAETEKKMRDMLGRRDAIVAKLIERNRQNDRAGFIAGVLAGLLTEPTFRVDGHLLRQSLMERRQTMDAEVQALYAKQQSAPFADKIALRETILAKGVPSHRVVKAMWTARAAANAGKGD